MLRVMDVQFFHVPQIFIAQILGNATVYTGRESHVSERYIFLLGTLGVC